MSGETNRKSMEVVVKFINICYNEDKEILKRSRTLREYSLLMHYIDQGTRMGLGRDEAVEIAVKRTAAEGILREFLRKNGSEVVGMMHGEVTMERYGEIRWEEGREDGYKECCLEIAKKFKNLGTPVKDISEATGLTVEEIEALEEQTMGQANSACLFI